MRRWLLVLLVAAAAAVALLGLRHYQGQRGVADEILAYEVTERRDVIALVPGVAQRVALSSWLLLAPDPPFDPSRPYHYSLEVTLMDAHERVLFRRTLDAVSRISGDPAEPVAKGRFAARLVGGAAWVTDARTMRVDVSPLGGQPGLLRVRAAAGTLARAVVRLSFAQARGELERQVAERTLGVNQRRRLTVGRSALGFADLPQDARQRALATWGRRLTVRGRDGVDYTTRRLLLGGWRYVAQDDPTAYRGVWIGGGLQAAYNVSGPVRLRVHAPAGTSLQARDGEQDPFEVMVTDSGQVDLPFDEQGPRTVAISSAERVLVHCSLPADQATRPIGHALGVVRGDRLIVGPDQRVQHYWMLQRHEPVIWAMAAGQSMVGLSVRGRARSEGDGILRGTVRARWRGVDARAAELEATLTPSPFETVDGELVTEPQVTLLRIPAEATGLELTGDPRLLVAAWTSEPNVEERRLDPAYDVELGDDRTWRYAPHEVSSFAPLRPANQERLEAGGRLARLLAQVRIEPIEPDGVPISERVLDPRADPLARHLLKPGYHSRGAPAGPHTYTEIGDEPVELVISAAGPRAAELRLMYRADAAVLGEELELLVDGDSVLSRPLAVRTGELTLPVEPGPLTVRLAGLGPLGQALAQAVPADGGGVVKRQRLYELDRDEPLDFAFHRAPGELLTVILVVASERSAVDYRVYYRIDDGQGDERTTGFLRRMTEFSGILSGRTGSRGRAQLWEAGLDATEAEPTRRRADYLGEARIRLGDDLTARPHRLRLSLRAGAGPLWVRAVLVGRQVEGAQEVRR